MCCIMPLGLDLVIVIRNHVKCFHNVLYLQSQYIFSTINYAFVYLGAKKISLIKVFYQSPYKGVIFKNYKAFTHSILTLLTTFFLFNKVCIFYTYFVQCEFNCYSNKFNNFARYWIWIATSSVFHLEQFCSPRFRIIGKV